MATLELVGKTGTRVQKKTKIKKNRVPHLMLEFVDVKVRARKAEGVQVFSARVGEAVAEEIRATKQRIAEGSFTVRVYRNRK